VADKVKPRVLLVDDDEKILRALVRSLRGSFDLTTATSGAEGLEMLDREAPFEVIVSDMKMPQMNGATFLKHAYTKCPDTVRLLLTGFAEMDTIVDAVNYGHIYRFMTKPVSATVLRGVLVDAVKQHHLLTAEKVLLEQTLQGSVQALMDVLALADPAAFGRVTRIKKQAISVALALRSEDRWQIEIAAMFSQIGSITLTEAVTTKLYYGQQLTEEEQHQVDRLPEITARILSHIPRLDDVARIVRLQMKNYDGTGVPDEPVSGHDIPVGARILHVINDFESLKASGISPADSFETLRARTGYYDPKVVDAFCRIFEENTDSTGQRAMLTGDLLCDMTLARDVKSTAGVLLVSAGQVVNENLLEKLQNYSHTLGIEEPIWIETQEDQNSADQAATNEQDGAGVEPVAS